MPEEELDFLFPRPPFLQMFVHHVFEGDRSLCRDREVKENIENRVKYVKQMSTDAAIYCISNKINAKLCVARLTLTPLSVLSLEIFSGGNKTYL